MNRYESDRIGIIVWLTNGGELGVVLADALDGVQLYVDDLSRP